MDPATIMMITKIAGMASGSAGGGDSGMSPTRMVAGGVQMLVGLSQARKARKLPFPDYTSGMQYANENMEMYRRQYQQGLGQNVLGGIRKETSAETAKTLRSLSETSPQFAGQTASRVGALDRLSTEINLSNLDNSFRQQAISGMSSAASEISGIQQRDVQAKRQYRMQAEQAAGQAIARGSENLVQGVDALSKSIGG